MASRKYLFKDTAQHIVGGFLLAGPFVVTEEVWRLASHMSLLHILATVGIVLVVGYGALYQAIERDPEREAVFVGVPVRYLSLIFVSYLSVGILAYVFSAPSTFNASPLLTLKATCIGSVFSVIGAATTDSLF